MSEDAFRIALAFRNPDMIDDVMEWPDSAVRSFYLARLSSEQRRDYDQREHERVMAERHRRIHGDNAV